MEKRFEHIISNYFDDTISEAETKELISWVNNGNRKVFDEYVALNYDLEVIKVEGSKEQNLLWNKIEAKINKKDIKKLIPFYRKNYFKYAASILLLISAGYFFLNNEWSGSKNEPVVKVTNDTKPGTDKATLTLADGSEIVLEKGEKLNTANFESNGEQIVYNNSNKPSTEIAWNILTIPRGGQYHIKLPDNSEIWLNSESKLKYPTAFIDGQERKIELLYGEAFLHISPSSENKSANFKLITGIQEIEVLGTQFNVKAYADENQIFTTLIEGSISLASAGHLEVLTPNQQAVLSKKDHDLEIKTIDVNSEIGWVKGDFIFNRMKLKDIVKVLSRWYDVDFKFENEELKEARFYGDLSKNQDLFKILNLIKSTDVINSYHQRDKIIILK